MLDASFMFHVQTRNPFWTAEIFFSPLPHFLISKEEKRNTLSLSWCVSGRRHCHADELRESGDRKSTQDPLEEKPLCHVFYAAVPPGKFSF